MSMLTKHAMIILLMVDMNMLFDLCHIKNIQKEQSCH